MAALDTNVVVRLLMGDDIAQARAAEALVARESCTVSLAVLMECEWVLRAAYGLHVATIVDLLAGLLALQNLDADDPALAAEVLLAYAAGLDFAGALHALQARPHGSFATFDKTLVRRAGKWSLSHVRLVSKP